MTRNAARPSLVAPVLLLALAGGAAAQGAKEQAIRAIDSRQSRYVDVAHQIWTFAEVGYKEQRSSALLQQELKEAGFKVTSGAAGIPTAFVAEYGSGKPVIAMYAEFDALPGLSQDATPDRKPIAEGEPGHGCGHNLLGTASTAAAIAVKDWLAGSKRAGTIRLYGTPAEEGGSGKVYMVRDGLFKDVDAVVAWHPGDANNASPETNLANVSAKFRFHGVSAHAAAAPDKGRSALDAVEAMDAMVNLMREHVPQETRIHYVITNGGKAPNVVPDFAEVYYYARHPDPRVLKDVWDRIVKASEGAALGTGTTVEHEIVGGTYALLPNETIARLMDANMRKLGGIHYTPQEQAFAEQIRKTLDHPARPLGSEAEVQPFKAGLTSASTDAGDISWNVPMAEINTATWVPGTSAHSWQAVAADGMSIGAKGMNLAAKVLAMTAIDLFTTPATLQAARAEFERKRGPDFKYAPLLGDRQPALDYRN
ncbi:MAG TPA: amidohydrolase [Longimicrobiales bacterium]|nr:amidohydrolase [Longimicrobiales bacterium]